MVGLSCHSKNGAGPLLYRMRQSIKLAFTTVRGATFFWGERGGDDMVFGLDAAINVWNMY